MELAPINGARARNSEIGSLSDRLTSVGIEEKQVVGANFRDTQDESILSTIGVADVVEIDPALPPGSDSPDIRESIYLIDDHCPAIGWRSALGSIHLLQFGIGAIGGPGGAGEQAG